MPLKVTGYRTETPSLIATTVVREDDGHWWVKCENCTNVITVGKRHWVPNWPFTDESGYTEVQLTAPGAMRCVACGPWPGSAADKALKFQQGKR